MDTLAAELRAAADAIDKVAHEQRCWSVISNAVAACTDHITAIAGNVEKNYRILALEAATSGTGMPSSEPLAIVERIVLGRIQRNVAIALAVRFGRWTSTEQLVAAAWGDQSSGGPLNANKVIDVVVYNLRRKLKLTGLAIEGAPYSGRRMVRI
jgi:DNA-binding response OmpR family regulator